MLGTFDQILAYFVVPTVIFVVLTVAAVFVLRARGPAGGRAAVGPWHPAPAPALPGADHRSCSCSWPWTSRAHAAIGLGVVLLGLPVYQLVFARPGRGLAGRRRPIRLGS